jgi:CRISPR-associated protein Csd1
MILQALVDYYNRKASDPEANMAPPGFENKEIPFLIILNEKGEFIDLQDTRESVGKKLTGRKFRIPQSIKRSGTNPTPNYLWDNISYVFGIENHEKKNSDSGKRKKTAFLNKIKEEHPELKDNIEIQAIVKFLESDFLPTLEKHTLWKELCDSPSNITFQITDRDHLVCQNPEVVEAIASNVQNKEEEKGICLLTGELDSIARIHHSIKGIQGALTSGANIVSNNLDATKSFGKKQGDNAPIGKKACFAYTTALNHLLRSRQKIAFGEATTIIFWSAQESTFENLLADMMETPPKDDPDRMTRAINSLYEAPIRGALAIEEDNTKFFILGISPNSSRLSIRFWWNSTIRDLAKNIKQHFDDLSIVGKKEFFSLYQLMQGLTFEGDIKKLQPKLAGSILKSIFQGTCYPFSILSSILDRLKDKEGISHRRSAMLKAWINRYTRKFQITEKEIHVALDDKNQNIGYCLGRLFAVLEKVQHEALGDTNKTIRDRFYGAAAAMPVTVFPSLLKIKNHHLAKLENRGRAINLEKLIGEIMKNISDFPSILPLVDQGRFAIGYYHQKTNFFNKQET